MALACVCYLFKDKLENLSEKIGLPLELEEMHERTND